ncbi:hypothetical protein KO353_09900 [Elioraea tepida]|jgi:hypothetical protein|uniref:Uncharacterized protein n=1 Tax=Elioraea tepida TaxID=2843330 RepID=A0A975TZV7_9PROT|nr:hypothetical protein [Elioraea tepida]QXM23627.1 hypothetical protein KO353_09900 [Elioraea tepida]
MSLASHRRHAPVLTDISDVVPFASAEEAWFWTMAGLSARAAGARIVAGLGVKPRPCEPDDVVRCLDRLYRQRRIDLVHVRILKMYGERQVPPDPRHPADRSAWRLWREALDRLDWPLRLKGIVA